MVSSREPVRIWTMGASGKVGAEDWILGRRVRRVEKARRRVSELAEASASISRERRPEEISSSKSRLAGQRSRPERDEGLVEGGPKVVSRSSSGVAFLIVTTSEMEAG